METITMTNTTQITRVRFACPQAADRILNGVDRIRVGVRGAFRGTGLSAFGLGAKGGFGADLQITTVTPVQANYAPMHKTTAVKDVAYLRSWRPPA
jgi:hypothetical protein